MIPSILSSLSSSNTGSNRLSVTETSVPGANSRPTSLESTLSSSPPISHPLLRNQWASRTSTSSIVSPATSPLMTRYPSRQSSSELTIPLDDQNCNEQEVFSIFSSLDWTTIPRGPTGWPRIALQCSAKNEPLQRSQEVFHCITIPPTFSSDNCNILAKK